MTYYIKKGRKYIAVAEEKKWDSIPYGFHIVSVKSGATSWKYNIKPDFLVLEAALTVAKNAMIEKMLEKNESKLNIGQYPENVRDKAEKAFKAWKDIMGEDVPVCFEGISMNDLVEAALQAVRDEVNGTDK